MDPRTVTFGELSAWPQPWGPDKAFHSMERSFFGPQIQPGWRGGLQAAPVQVLSGRDRHSAPRPTVWARRYRTLAEGVGRGAETEVLRTPGAPKGNSSGATTGASGTQCSCLLVTSPGPAEWRRKCFISEDLAGRLAGWTGQHS